MKKTAFCLLILSVISYKAHAIGEIMSVKTTGTQYCPGFKPFHFTPANSTPIFLQVDSDDSVSAFLGGLKETPDFELDLFYDAIGTNTASFSMSYYENEFNHVEVIGRATADKTGLVKKITGTFIRVGLIDGCYATGKLTGKRIN